ncbi:hypothetical protein VTK73DRAFT_8425 [Phialemonium thermophilum]|uniref:Uncharacterized protein n=1 Tax=Phialemonium thermophilum TaxID=223376 RepID=A0ABR3W8P0_9PEZI
MSTSPNPLWRLFHSSSCGPSFDTIRSPAPLHVAIAERASPFSSEEQEAQSLPEERDVFSHNSHFTRSLQTTLHSPSICGYARQIPRHVLLSSLIPCSSLLPQATPVSHPPRLASRPKILITIPDVCGVAPFQLLGHHLPDQTASPPVLGYYMANTDNTGTHTLTHSVHTYISHTSTYVDPASSPSSPA